MMSNQAQERRRIVVLVDNRTVEPWADALRQRNYTVLSATSAEQALELIEDRWVHLLVIDARLRDDDDPLDDSGIQLTRDSRLKIYQQIIYTAYPQDVALQLIQATYGTLPANLRIYSKRDADIVTIVDRAFVPRSQGGTGQVGINFDQRLIYSDGLTTLSLVSRLRNAPTDGETIVARIGEIEDLFGKAFIGCDMLRITPITSGRGGGFVLIVTPEQDQQTQRTQLVKCGERRSIAREYRNYREHVRDFVDFAAHLTEDRTIETLHIGLLKYHIAFGDIDETITFADFYRRNGSDMICQAIRNLFGRALFPWQRGPNPPRTQNSSLSRFYEDRLLFRSRNQTVDHATLWNAIGERTRHAAKDVPSPVGVRPRNGTLIWTIGERQIELPEPHSYLAAVRGGQHALFSDRYLACRCHGDLHVENIRVTDDAQTWLIDFEYAGWGPLLQDAIQLESSILFGMIADRRLDCLLLLIECLASQTDFDTPPELPAPLRDSAELAKAIEVISELRSEAGKVEGARMADYLLGLAYHALRMITNERPPSWADMRKLTFYKTLALFLAAACCQQIDTLVAAPMPSDEA
jgi:hypothetical protein